MTQAAKLSDGTKHNLFSFSNSYDSSFLDPRWNHIRREEKKERERERKWKQKRKVES